MCDAMELFDYWHEFPPMHVLMRGYVGYKPERVPDKNDAVQSLRAMAPGSGPKKKLSQAPEYIRKMAETLKNG
jgi:hypothetical protein